MLYNISDTSVNTALRYTEAIKLIILKVLTN